MIGKVINSNYLFISGRLTVTKDNKTAPTRLLLVLTVPVDGYQFMDISRIQTRTIKINIFKLLK